MKTHFTDETLQAAIDDACNDTPITGSCTNIDIRSTCLAWEREAPARLALARALLSRLPDPQPPVVDVKTPGQVAHAGYLQEGNYGSDEKWECAASAVLAAFGQPDAVDWQQKAEYWSESYRFQQEKLLEQQDRAEKAEELAAIETRKRLYAEEQLGILAKTFGYEGRTWCNMVSYLCPRLQKAEARIKELESNLPQLRPLSEAGPVPEGCVRLTRYAKEKDWYFGNYHSSQDTHFVDIRLPELLPIATLSHDQIQATPEMLIAADAVMREMMDEPTTFEAHGKTWTRYTRGDPMPCEVNRRVDVITQKNLDEGNWFSCPHDGSYWEWNRSTNIIGWRYADEPADPYAELKEAHAAGKVIQYNCGTESDPQWEDIPDPEFGDGADAYRIKPWTLPPPPEGQEWHRTDWTEDMLPEGWRPHLLGETDAKNDERYVRGKWIKLTEVEWPSDEHCDHRRTSRPLPQTSVTVPLDACDIRATDEFRYKEGDVIQTITSWNRHDVELPRDGVVDYAELADNYLRRQHGSDEWKPCTKEAK